jgi:hypothetical protein
MNMRGYKRSAAGWITLLLMIFLSSGCSRGTNAGGSADAGGPADAGGNGVRVEIGYLSHGPVKDALNEVDKLLARYGVKVQVSRYDLDTVEGKAFAKRVNLTTHTPLVLYINGQMEVEGKDGRKVKLFSFPAGLGTGMTPGSGWNMTDLEAALDRATGGKP